MPFSSVLGASSVIRPGVCTSTTRPTVPYEGQLIYETDTDRLLSYNGSAWINYDSVWTVYTPTWTNLTVGNATQNFRYLQHGKLVFVIGSIVFGSTTSLTATGAIFSLPITSATGSSSQYWGTVSYLDSGTEEYVGSMKMLSTTTMQLRVPNVAGTYQTSGSPMTTTVPFTWGTGDAAYVSFFYETV